MDVDTVTLFLALMALLGLVFLFLCLVVFVISVVNGFRSKTADSNRPILPASLLPLRNGLGQVALPLAFGVALACTLGSLYLSDIAKFPPCKLCWYQRIAMYPEVLLLGIAAIRKDVLIKFYAVPLALIGLGISIYHYLVERFPDTVSFSCTSDVPCSTVWVWKFHFLSIPAMAGIGFALISVLALLARTEELPRNDEPVLASAAPTSETEEL
ncbi:MAG: disulfide oxidoreductase [Microthrixaceae bacterium]